MFHGKTLLGIIPARAGSKRLKNKNRLKIAGKPLITWTIEAALESKYIDHVVVTSDEDKILSISESFGVSKIKRPSNLANDTATTFDTVRHVIETIKKKYDFIVLLQPTSPLRNSEHIDKAINTLKTKKADAIVSVCKMEHSPLWSNLLPEDGGMNNFIKEEIKNKRSQDLDTFYRLNGAIYICKTDRLLAEKSFLLKEKTFAYKMSKENSVDIDEELDLKLAELLLINEKNR